MNQPQRHRGTEKTIGVVRRLRRLHRLVSPTFLFSSASSAQSADTSASTLCLCGSVVQPSFPRPRVSGTAMTETVLTLPLILLMLALIFFFGVSLTRLQRTSVTDRYEAWRQAEYATGPGAEFDKNPSDFGVTSLLNEAFFAGNADSLDISDRSGRVRVDEPTDLVAEQTLINALALNDPKYESRVAEDLVREQARRSPAWWRIDIATEHTWDVPLYQRFKGPIHHQHTRIDGDWSFASWIEQEYRGDRKKLGDILNDEVYFTGDIESDNDKQPDLDSLVAHSVPGVYHSFHEPFDAWLLPMDEDNDNPLARAIRLIYLSYGGYEGPALLPERDKYYRWYRPQPEPDEGDPLQ